VPADERAAGQPVVLGAKDIHRADEMLERPQIGRAFGIFDADEPAAVRQVGVKIVDIGVFIKRYPFIGFQDIGKLVLRPSADGENEIRAEVLGRAP